MAKEEKKDWKEGVEQSNEPPSSFFYTHSLSREIIFQNSQQGNTCTASQFHIPHCPLPTLLICPDTAIFIMNWTPVLCLLQGTGQFSRLILKRVSIVTREHNYLNYTMPEGRTIPLLDIFKKQYNFYTIHY